MAKKKAATPKISKTDAIREALKTTPGGSPSMVAKQLVAKGIKVTPAYVSTIKAADKRRELSGRPRRKPGRPAGSGATNGSYSTAGSVKEDLMLKAIDLVVASGAREAHQMINLAEQLVSRVR